MTATKIKHLVVGTPQGIAGDLRKEARFAFNYSAYESSWEISLAMPCGLKVLRAVRLSPLQDRRGLRQGGRPG